MTTSMQHPGWRPRRATGFTLVEMTVSCAMLAIICTALTSAMLLASRAIPNGKTVNSGMLAASRFNEQLNNELSLALSVTELTPTSIAFTVADRNGDGSVETIRYAWSGIAGSAITRQYNSAAAVSVLDNVSECAFVYDRNKVQQSQTYTDGTEQLLYSYTGSLLASAQDIDSNNWMGQVIAPSLGSNAARWRITRVQFSARAHGPAIGEARLQVRSVDSGGLPTATVLDQVKFLESSLTTTWSWVSVTLSNQPAIDASANAAVLVRWVSDADACDVQYQSLLGILSNSYLVKTTNAGTIWTSNSLGALPMYVYGTISTKDPILYRYYLTNVRATVRTGSDTASRVVTNVNVVTQPEVGAP